MKRNANKFISYTIYWSRLILIHTHGKGDDADAIANLQNHGWWWWWKKIIQAHVFVDIKPLNSLVF